MEQVGTMIDVEPARAKLNGVTYELEPAVIASTHLGYEDHGVFTGILMLAFNGGGRQQGFGLGCLDTADRDKGRQGTASGMDWIIQTMCAVGVECWEDVVGTRVYALRREPDGRIEGIMSIDANRAPFLMQAHVAHGKGRAR